jgi:uncharacterized membrane protein YfcA
MDLAAIAVTVAAVYLTTFMKGAFGGGFAIIGIPLMALAMDPVMAGALLAPVFCLSDLLALRYWRVSTWSKPDLAVLVPGQIAGVAAGFALLSVANADMIAVAIASLTLIFAASWFMRGGKIVPKPRSPAKGVVAGIASGVSSMVAHSGGPPVAMYLLPLGLSKDVYAGTTFMFFVVGNYLKVGPWLTLVEPTRDWWMLLARSLPVIPLGVWSGWRLHERLDQTQLYRACYVLLSIVGMKLLWDGLYGLVTG